MSSVVNDENMSIIRTEDIALAVQKDLDGIVVITGSSALQRYGLKVYDGQLKDLDLILINPSESDQTKLKLLQKSAPANKISSYWRDKHLEVKYQFTYRGMPVDIFIERIPEPDSGLTYFSTRCFQYPAHVVRYNNPARIMAAKKRLNRMKDWRQLAAVAALVMDGYDKFLSSLPDALKPVKAE